jgi:hypothetical protein
VSCRLPANADNRMVMPRMRPFQGEPECRKVSSEAIESPRSPSSRRSPPSRRRPSSQRSHSRQVARPTRRADVHRPEGGPLRRSL